MKSKPKDTKSLPLVVVQWVDVHNVAGGWHDEDELNDFAKNEAYKVMSLGCKVYEDDKCIVLCSRYSPKTDEYGSHYGMIERIPLKVIDSITELNDLASTDSDTTTEPLKSAPKSTNDKEAYGEGGNGE